MSEIKIRKNKTINNPITDTGISLLIGNISFIAFICTSALIITKIQIKSDILYLLIIISSALSSLITSFVSARKARKNKLLFGIISSGLLVIFHFLIILCFNNSDLAVKTYLIFPADIVTGLIGAVTGINIIRK